MKDLGKKMTNSFVPYPVPKRKKGKKAVAEKKVWYIDVDRDTYCTVTREASGDEWDRDSTHTEHHVNGLRLVEQDGYGVVGVNFKPEKGKLYHLLYAVYSTGDSFGHDAGRCFEVVGIYKDRKVAEENEKRLLLPGRKFKDWTVDLKTEGQGVHKYMRPWMGYFESLDRLEVLTLVLN